MRKIWDDLHQLIWDFCYDILAVWYSLYPIKKNKIVIVSYYGADFGDNGKYIVSELKRRNTDADIVWLLKKELIEKNSLPEGIRGVEYRSFRSVYELETASVWIDNARKTYGIKRRKQLYIQTWHGGPGVKRIEKDVEGELGARYVRNAKRDSAMCDMILSNSKFMTDLFTRVFWYNGHVEECGTPRNDILCAEDPDCRKKIRDYYKVPQDKKIVLYAPTFRKDKRLDVYDIDLVRCCRELSARFGGEYIAYVRLHPNISDMADLMPVDNELLYNATTYPDMQELLSGVDCLITDYSSSSVDFSLTGKPCFLYASDIEEYRNNRGYYFGFDDLPYGIAKDNDELERLIADFSEEECAQRVEKFHEMTGMFDKGTACRSCADIIEKHINS